MKPFIFYLFCFFTAGSLHGQVKDRLHFEAGIGAGISAGRSIMAEKTSDINSWTVNYLSTERYKYPQFRFRGSALCQLGKIAVGIRSGADVIYFERNIFGELETYLAIPVELVTSWSVFNINEKRAVFISGSAGYKSRKREKGIVSEKGGLLASGELSVGGRKRQSMFVFKAGFEYAQENLALQLINPPNSNLQSETISFVTQRKIFFFMVAYGF